MTEITAPAAAAADAAEAVRRICHYSNHDFGRASDINDVAWSLENMAARLTEVLDLMSVAIQSRSDLGLLRDDRGHPAAETAGDAVRVLDEARGRAFALYGALSVAAEILVHLAGPGLPRGEVGNPPAPEPEPDSSVARFLARVRRYEQAKQDVRALISSASSGDAVTSPPGDSPTTQRREADPVYLVYTAPGEIYGVYATRELAEAEAEAERAECRALGVPVAADRVLVVETAPRTSLRLRPAEQPPLPWDELTDAERTVATALGRTREIHDMENREWRPNSPGATPPPAPTETWGQERGASRHEPPTGPDPSRRNGSERVSDGT